MFQSLKVQMDGFQNCMTKMDDTVDVIFGSELAISARGRRRIHSWVVSSLK
jgi:hypothetical protein